MSQTILTPRNRALGFSKRFNRLLDLAEYPVRGRGGLLAKELDLGRSSVHLWLVSDSPPKRDKLRIIVRHILGRMSKPPALNTVVAWLEHDTGDPFRDHAGHRVHQGADYKHEMLSRMYIAVHRVAKEMKVNLFAIDSEIMDEFYNQVIVHTTSQGLQEPDRLFVHGLLAVIAKQQTASTRPRNKPRRRKE